MKVIFLAWESYHARTQFLAEALGARPYYISRLGRVSGPKLLLKYVLQSFDTLAVLLRERPDVVLVQTPPVFVALLPTLYAAVFRRTRVIVDAHSGNFFSPKWTWSLPLQGWCSRRAQLTIVHMRSLLPVVRGWGAEAIEMGYVFDEHGPAESEPYPLPPGTHIAMPCSFGDDEPVEEIFDAAKQLPDVTFHLTGNWRRLPAEVQQRKPANVVFTGYLGVPAFMGLLRAADAVLALTTQDQTFQTGGAEAVWLERPLIISDWLELQSVFSRGAVFVDNTAAGLARAVREVQARGDELQEGMRQLKQEFDRGLRARLRWLRAVVDEESHAPSRQVGDWAAD